MAQKKNGTYYLGRVIKREMLTPETLIEAILNPRPITVRGFDWTFINVQKGRIGNTDFIYGKLCKYSPDAEVMVIDPEKGEEVKQDEPNLRIASSPFVYIPEFSGISFLRVANNIEPKTFMKRFAALVTHKHQNFFVGCEVEPIADLRSFAVKLSKLEGIFDISASVSPPNPLFGPLWEDLKNYLKTRRADRMKIHEESGRDNTISTNLPNLVKNASEQTPEKPFIVPGKIDIGDAAILMAADGYGSGYVRGREKGETVVINTSETMKNFSFPKDPKPEGLFRKSYDIFRKIKEDRHMKHDKK